MFSRTVALVIVGLSLFLNSQFAFAQFRTVLWNENFESCSLPAGWRVSQRDPSCNTSWSVNTPSALSSQYFAIPSNGSSCIAAINDDGDNQNCNRGNGDTLFSKVGILSGANNTLMVYLDYYYLDGTYSGASESFELYVSRDSGKTWQLAHTFTDVGSGWGSALVNLSSFMDPAKDDTVMLAFVYKDGNGWLYGAAIDNVVLFVPYELDAGIIDIFTVPYVSAGNNVPFAFTIRNYGATPISNITLQYSLAHTNASGTINLSFSTPLAPGSDTTITNTQVVANVPNVVETLTLNIQHVNGVVDSVQANDTVHTSFYVPAEVFNRQSLCEDFTNASCAPCASFNPIFKGYIDTTRHKTVPLMYHVWWPGSNDPMYLFNTADVQTRTSFYGVTGVPAPFTDGQEGLSPSLVNFNVSIKAIYDLQLEAYYLDSSKTSFEIIVKTNNGNNDIAKFAQINGITGLNVFVAVAEESVTYDQPPGTNGEKFFPWVMRTMLPDANGTSINLSSTSNDSTVLTFTYQIDTTVIDKDSVYVVAWIQATNGDLLVLNATETVPTFKVDTVTSDSTVGTLYPNTTSTEIKATITDNQLEVYANAPVSDVNIYVMTPDGKAMTYVAENYKLNRGMNRFSLPNMSSGYYFVVINRANDHIVLPVNKLD
ncbi:MAG: hypothetical protein GXO48_09410 [Chlorobi bacterium]|nr:hypothetical protein [Chlorobiota bacterium]